MAGAHFSSFIYSHSICATKAPKTLLSSISISNPRRRRPNTRKNYLRPKLLKTISIPILPLPPTHISDTALFLPQQKDSNFPDQDLKIQQTHQFRPAESLPDVDIAKVRNNSFLKLWLGLAAAFIVQTVCAILVFNSADRKGNYESNDHESKVDVIVNANEGVLLITDEQMQNKIQEIKIMAREARDRERLERDNNGLDGNNSDIEDEEDEDFGKTGIGKEVTERLNMLREKLKRNRDKIPEIFENLQGDSVMKGSDTNIGVDTKPGNEGLVFRKKYKFKGSIRDHSDRPNGFSGSSEKEHSKVEERRFDSKNEVMRSGSHLGDGSKLLDDDQRLKMDIPDGNGRRHISKDTERRQQGRNIDVAECKFPKVQDRNTGSPVAVTVDSRDPSILKADEATNHQSRISSSSSSHGGGQQLKQSGSFKKPRSGSEWWTKLPYVFVILMQKSDDGDKVRGLYTLKSSSCTDYELSHIVAFQERGDATNFCYLLQLYFEDLGDFSIDVIPLSMKELKEATESNTKRVIVIKKGQLQLLSGQPISDVEVALRSLMEQD